MVFVTKLTLIARPKLPTKYLEMTLHFSTYNTGYPGNEDSAHRSCEQRNTQMLLQCAVYEMSPSAFSEIKGGAH